MDTEATEHQNFYALIFDEARESWIAYQRPIRIIRADEPEQVVPALDRVEAETARGNTAVGYVSYEAATALDPALVVHPSELPLLMFAVFKKGHPVELHSSEDEKIRMEAELSEPEYIRRFTSVRKYLSEGDSYQVNLTFKLRGKSYGNTRQLFARLVHSQPGTRSVYLEWDDAAVCSLSPELYFKRDAEQLTMEPMKGTRPRGLDYASDVGLGRELLHSEKERAENLMIVDMIRNDLGKIATPGSVRADELFRILRLPTLWQQVSTVSCQTDASLPEIFKATFPCASITGAPKARTMEIIRELESGPRGIYTGAVGYVMPGGRAQFNVAIRTLMIQRRSGQAELGVGGGIVWDSEAGSEWQEAHNKARFLVSQVTQDFSLLETMLYEPDQGIYLLQRHLERLRLSAEFFAYPCDIVHVEHLLREFTSEKRQRLRLLLDSQGAISLDTTLLIENTAPVRLMTAAKAVQLTNPFLRFKTTQRADYEEAQKDMDWCGAQWDDLILHNERGELTETCIYNLYLEIDGELLTPARESGLLAGTYRQMLLDDGKAREAVLRLEDLEQASRIFVSNSVRGLREATLVNQADNAIAAFQA